MDTRSRATAVEVASIFATDEMLLPGNQRPGKVLYPLSYAGTFIRRQDSNLSRFTGV
ncbi:MAG TPA: hypothetical protein VKE93_19775 [Candidatus Angelobacter sp.]|nr:hypothetical protein [Candidatus Angelobacter sp.]